MTLEQARSIIMTQRHSFKRLNNLRFTDGGYEYRIRYEGGFTEFFSIDRRAIGSRNFRYYHGFGAWDMPGSKAVWAHITDTIHRTTGV